MAQTKKKRRRKHRGTQGGGIDTRAGRGRPRTREEARAQAKRRSEMKRGGRASAREAPPTWRSAINRGLIGAVIFFALTVFLFGKTVGEAAALAAVMLVLYIPLGYFVDNFFYKRRRAQELRARAAAKQAKQGK